MAEQLLTIAEAARRMGVSPKVVRTLIEHEQLPAIQVGDRLRIQSTVVDLWRASYLTAAMTARAVLENAGLLPSEEKR